MKLKLLRQIIDMSKYTIYGICIQCLFLSMTLAKEGNAQMKSVEEIYLTVNLKQNNVESIFAQISSETEFDFIYNNNLLEKQKNISLNVENKSLGNVLRLISKKTDLQFKRVNQDIIVSKRKINKPNLVEVLDKQTAVADIDISGKITSAIDGSGLPGASVLIKGTTNGVVTDLDGNYKLSVPSSESVLVISFVGYVQLEVVVGSKSVIDLAMDEDTQNLADVVVTALGISKEKNALGYAVQEVSGDDIKNSGETNIINSLSGKSAGVYVNSSNGNVGSSSRITIRGNSSLTGNNQPLFVVDGVPIDNSIVSSARGQADNLGTGFQADFVDMGNGAADINPNDIAEMTILKGGSAAALYGSRGANGVILITTKRGSKKGFSVEVENSTTFSSPLVLPDYQNEYGQGGGGQFWYKDGLNGGKNDGVDESFGPRLDYTVQPEDIVPGGKLYWAVEAGFPQSAGQILSLPQFDSPVNPTTGEKIPSPWISHPDNVSGFYETGVTRITSAALSNGGEWGNIRLAFTNSDQTGMTPNTNQVKNTINFSGKTNITDKLSFDASGSYINTTGNPNGSGYTFANIGMQTVWTARQVDWEYEKNNVENPDGTMNSWINRWHNNPYWMQYKNLNPVTKNRLIASSSLNYQFNDWLSLTAMVGTDFSNQQVELIRAYYGNNDKEGRYNVTNYFRQETNANFLLTANKNLTEDLRISANIGGNLMNNKYRTQGSYVTQLVVPNVYSLSNAKNTPTTTYFQTEKEIQSVYAAVSLDYKSQLYLDLTGRNDWSSTLPVTGNSYFYPSATTSWILTETFDIDPKLLSFGKIRVGWAQVGNDTDPYRLSSTYSASTPYGNNPSFSLGSVMPPANLVNELITSKELGLDVKFFNNRIGLDVTFYKSVAKNQILSAKVSNTSGFTSQTINAGQVDNSGTEIMLTGTPIVTNDFSWDVTLNWSKNNSKIIALNGDIQRLELYKTEGNQITVVADVGGSYGDMWGKGFVYHENGKPMVNDTGVPMTSDVRKLGNVMPDWLAGINNSFSYKSFNFSFLIDARVGGDIWSRTNADGWATGSLKSSVGLNDNGVPVRDPIADGGGWLFDGVFENGAANNIYKDLDGFRWNGWAKGERWLYDATYVKLRQVMFTYSLPSSLISKLSLQNVNVSVFARNVAILHKNTENFDPEVSNRNASQSSQGGEFASNPSARNIGFRLKLTF
jgi:TonB-linked SusC/RagA family outer membrane protein